MNEWKKAQMGKRRINADKQTTGVAQPGNRNEQKRIKKECFGCGDNFTCFKQNNYDYCRNCTLNGNRYVQNQCPECGDGSGLIKFKNQPLRACKLCSLQPRIIQQEVKHA